MNCNVKNRWLILVNVLMLTLMAVIDSSIVNIALPSIAKNLNVSTAMVGMVVTSYLIVISASILLFGRLGDIKGKSKIFILGLGLFTLGSLLCGVSNNIYLLIASRIIQAIGGAASMANSQGIITEVFPASERGKALGLVGTAVAIGAMIGPALGGFIVNNFTWEYIFLINIPIGIVAIIMAIKILPRKDGGSTEGLDIKGAVFFIISIVLLFGALTQGQEVGFDNIYIILAFIISIIAIILFVKFELNEARPMLDLSLFKNKLFSASILCAFISFVSLSTTNIILPLYYLEIRGLAPATVGLIMVISPIILTVIAPISGHLSDKYGSEKLTLYGLSIVSISFFILPFFNEKSNLVLFVANICLMTIGSGIFQSPNNSLVMSLAPKHKLGIVGSVSAFVRNIGMVVGVSMSTLILYTFMSLKMGHRVTDIIKGRKDVFVFGMHYVFIFAGILCLFGAFVTFIRLIDRNKKSAE